MWLSVCARVFHLSKSNLGHIQARQETEIWYVNCSHKYKINEGVMVGRRRPSVEDDLQWKTTIDGRQPLMEDEIQWKTSFGGSLHAAQSVTTTTITTTTKQLSWDVIQLKLAQFECILCIGKKS